MGFKVQKKMCETCPYRKDSVLDFRELEKRISDGYGGFTGFRACHCSIKGVGACCRGFWGRNKDKFALGQIAQRLNLVEFVKDIRRTALHRQIKNAKIGKPEFPTKNKG